MTQKQRGYAHALMKDIGESMGYLSKALAYETLKDRFREAMDLEVFSLGKTCTDEQYNDFIEFLMDIAIDYGLTSNHPLTPWKDLEKWAYFCIKHKTCQVTGRSGAEIYWIDQPKFNSYETPRPDLYRRISLSKDYIRIIKENGYDFFEKQFPDAVGIRCKLEGETWA